MNCEFRISYRKGYSVCAIESKSTKQQINISKLKKAEIELFPECRLSNRNDDAVMKALNKTFTPGLKIINKPYFFDSAAKNTQKQWYCF